MSDVKLFWCKVFFSEFVMHYAGMTRREVSEDVRASIKALSSLDDSGNSFGSLMVRKANERMSSKSACASRENGKEGGRPSVKLPKNKQEVIEFAVDNGLDTDDASTWAEQNLKERRGRDKNGNPIMNWKGALTNYCKKMAKRRNG